MKNMKKLYWSLIICAVLFSCQDQASPKLNSQEVHSGKSDFKNDAAYFSLMDSINYDGNLVEGSSLQYSDQHGTLFSSKVLSDAANRIYKLEMEISEAIETTESSFYFKNGKKIVSSKVVSHYGEEAVDYLKVISFYNDSGAVIYTGRAKSDNLDSLETVMYSSSELQNHEFDVAWNMINQTGAFQTTFLGTAFSEEIEKNFLIVGPKDGSYTSTLAISEETELIKKLKSNIQRYKGSLLTIEFDNITEPSGLTYQILVNATMNNVK